MCVDSLLRDKGYKGTTHLLLHLPRTVVMIGMMGVGKSVIGQRLATLLHVPFFDVDYEIESSFGCTIHEVFSSYGENAFRERERQMMASLLSGRVSVLSGGGGAFMDPQTRAMVQARAVSVWLKGSLDILICRTQGCIQRPLLQQGNPRRVLARLLAERSPLYAQADVIVESTEGSCEQMVERVARALAYHFNDAKL